MQIAMILKLLGLVTLFKDVTKEVQVAGEIKRPWYMQRTVWGSTLALIGGIGTAFFGFTLDKTTLDTLSQNIPELISVVVALWGAILSIVGGISKLTQKTV